MRKIRLISLLHISFILLLGCSTISGWLSVKNRGFAKGADIGWLPQMEATGYKFYNDKGLIVQPNTGQNMM